MDRENLMNKPEMFTNELYETTYNLAESLGQSEAILRFAKANQISADDQNAQQLIAEATALKQTLYAKDASREEMRKKFPRFQELQNQIAENPVLQEQSEAQEMAINFLRELNLEISQLLGFDFASLTRRQDASC